MKISILSMQHVDNIGSLLQAYALKTIVEGMGHSVVFRSINHNEKENSLIIGSVYNCADESDPGKRIDRYFINRLSNRIFMLKQKWVFNEFRKEFFISNCFNVSQDDCCIIGSDEVFNCLAPSPWGFTTQLFGNVDTVDRIITYAASCGMTRYVDLPEKARDLINKSLKRIHAFSARDKNTIDFLHNFNILTVSKHMDPVMIYDFDKEIIMGKRVIKRLPPKYILIYSYHNRIYRASEIQAIRLFARKYNLEIISIGQAQSWINKNVVVSPFEAIVVFKNAEFVVTDTFHGTILSARYATKYTIIIRPSNLNKLKDLCESLGISNHISCNMDLETKYRLSNDKDTISEIIRSEREKAYSYLNTNLHI